MGPLWPMTQLNATLALESYSLMVEVQICTATLSFNMVVHWEAGNRLTSVIDLSPAAPVLGIQYLTTEMLVHACSLLL